KQEQERQTRLTEKSKTLQDLVDALQKSELLRERRKLHRDRHQQRTSAARAEESFDHAKGRLRMPAAGRVISRYGSANADATYSKGMVIETRQQADVVAPFDGEVVFAGPFRDYGRIVIIRHGSEYHSMLTGLGAINCRTGQHLI